CSSDLDQEKISGFGGSLGTAFQLRDDLLDAFGDPGKVGKQPGGDLRAGKKTWLLIEGMRVEAVNGSSVLRDQLKFPVNDRDIAAMLLAIEKSGARSAAEKQVEMFENQAMEMLDAIEVPEERKKPLRELAEMLMARSY